MNQIIHKGCKGEIMYIQETENAKCVKCQLTMKTVNELLENISIMKFSDSEVASRSVKENK